LICSYSIKSEIITSIYNNKKLTSLNNKFKSHLIYIVIAIFQLIFLVIWTFTQKGIVITEKYLHGIGYYNEKKCSIGNENILNIIYSFDYVLVILSIYNTYRGRNSKYFF